MQLDLFTSARPPATILAFPIARQGDIVRETASALASRSYEAGRAYWSRHLKELRRTLKARGLSTQTIMDEIGRYSRAVAREVVTLSDYRQSV